MQPHDPRQAAEYLALTPFPQYTIAVAAFDFDRALWFGYTRQDTTLARGGAGSIAAAAWRRAERSLIRNWAALMT